MPPSMSVLLSVIVLVAACGACQARLPPIKCAGGDFAVPCFVHPCVVSPCKPKRNYECVANYCSKPTNYLGNLIRGGPCTAVWIDTTTNKTVACPPPIVPLPPIKTVPSTPIPPPITCAKGDIGVACILDPCSVSKCQPQPNYACVPNYCAKPTTYLGNAIPGSGCDAVWIDTTTNKTVTCPPSSPVPSPKPLALPAIKCAKGDIGVACLVDPCSFSTCQPQPNTVCVSNYCDKPTTYLGNLLPGGGCGAVLIDTTTNKTVPCTPEAAAAASTLCTNIYAPVCGTDKKTYSNACFATAAGVQVAFTGLCIFPPTCPKKYTPVCSDTGVTLPSRCSAEYIGVKNYTAGACLGGVCARCISPGTCKSGPSLCKGDPQYTCQEAFCTTQQVFDDGSRLTPPLCSAVYFNKQTGFPAAAC